MYKTISLVLILTVVGGLAVMSTGCGGGGGGGILGAALGIIAIAAIASSGGAGAAAFAANVREAPRAALEATTKYKAVIRVKGVFATETSNLQRSSDGKELHINAEISVTPGDNQYSIEIFPKDAPTTVLPLFKMYKVATVSNGGRTEEAPKFSAASTALALAYDEWPSKNSFFIDKFTPPDAAKVTALATKIQNYLDANLATVNQDSTLPPGVKTDAQTIANETPAPTPASSIFSGVAKIVRGSQWIPGQTEPQQVSQMQTVPDKIGIAFFQLPQPDNRPTLGNFFGPFSSFGNETKVIRYLPGVTSLDGVTQAGDTYNHHAFGGDSQATALAVNQVYGFLVDGYYGALQIHVVNESEVSIHYKYNTTNGDKNLNPPAFAAKIAY